MTEIDVCDKMRRMWMGRGGFQEILRTVSQMRKSHTCYDVFQMWIRLGAQKEERSAGDLSQMQITVLVQTKNKTG